MRQKYGYELLTAATQTKQPPTKKSGGDHALRLIKIEPYAGEFEVRRPASSTGGLGVGTPRSGFFLTRNSHSKDEFLSRTDFKFNFPSQFEMPQQSVPKPTLEKKSTHP
jgi:hypothetical protein